MSTTMPDLLEQAIALSSASMRRRTQPPLWLAFALGAALGVWVLGPVGVAVWWLW